MASHLSSRRWLLREFRLAYVPLVLAAFVVAIEQRFTGSIIVPTGGGYVRGIHSR
jgi:hypothetical protein